MKRVNFTGKKKNKGKKKTDTKSSEELDLMGAMGNECSETSPGSDTSENTVKSEFQVVNRGSGQFIDKLSDTHVPAVNPLEEFIQPTNRGITHEELSFFEDTNPKETRKKKSEGCMSPAGAGKDSNSQSRSTQPPIQAIGNNSGKSDKTHNKVPPRSLPENCRQQQQSRGNNSGKSDKTHNKVPPMSLPENCRQQQQSRGNGTSTPNRSSNNNNNMGELCASRFDGKYDAPKVKPTGEVPANIARIILTLIESRGGALPYTEAHTECEARLKRSIDLPRLGFLSFAHLLQKINEHIRVVQVGNQKMVYDSRLLSEEQIMQRDEIDLPGEVDDPNALHLEQNRRSLRSGFLPAETSTQLQSLLIDHFPLGVPCKQLAAVYFGIFGSVDDIRPEKYGCPDMSTLLAKETTILSVIDGHVISTTFNLQRHRKKIGQPMELGDAIPHQAVHKDFQFKFLEWSELLGPRQPFAAQINAYYSPSDFYLLVSGKDFSQSLHAMDERLQEFYKCHYVQDIYRMKRDNVIRDTQYPFCVYVSDDEMFYRAIFLSRKSAGFIEVFLVDYGNTETVWLNNIFYLHKSFTELRPMALKASLFFVRAPKFASTKFDDWPKASIRYLRDLVFDETLLVVPYELRENKASVQLFKVPQQFTDGKLDAITDRELPRSDLGVSMVENKFAEFIQTDRYRKFAGANLRKELDVAPPQTPVNAYNPIPYENTQSNHPESSPSLQTRTTSIGSISTLVEETDSSHTFSCSSYVKTVEVNGSALRSTVRLIVLNDRVYVPMKEFGYDPWIYDEIVHNILMYSKPRTIHVADYPDLFIELARQNIPYMCSADEQKKYCKKLMLLDFESLEVWRNDSYIVKDLMTAVRNLDIEDNHSS